MCTFNFDLSGGTEDRNLPANMGDMDLIPGPGRFHMPRSNEVCGPRLLHPCSRTCERQLLNPRATATGTHMRSREPLISETRESRGKVTKIQRSQT